MGDESSRLKEWETARSTIQKFDDRLHDLRKYGFSFLTALLTAESILIPAAVLATAESEPGVPSFIKLAVFGVTLLLIIALRLLDRYYILFIKAIADRALILERVLNLELTETISQRHRDEGFKNYSNGLYVAFAAGVGLLGSAILFPELLLIIILGVAVVVAMRLTYIIQAFTLGYEERGYEDWTIHPIEVRQGDSVRITVTNLHTRGDRVVELKGVPWEVKTQTGKSVYTEPDAGPISIDPQDSYIWIWDTSKVGPNIYRLFPHGRGALFRKIVVGAPRKPPPKVATPP